jgi:hypothetical protein
LRIIYTNICKAQTETYLVPTLNSRKSIERLATATNPTKIRGSDKLLPRLQQMLDGFCKADPPTMKQLPVEADVPEYLVKLVHDPEAREVHRAIGAIGDLTMIVLYYLLRIGEYTTKGSRNNSKQTQEFKLGDISSSRRTSRAICGVF